MRSATYHSKRPHQPLPRHCATCGARAIFTDKGQPICGPCFDKVIAALDATRREDDPTVGHEPVILYS